MEAKAKATIVGEVVKHTSARSKATCEISATGFVREDIDVNILSPSKVPVSYSLSETEGGLFFVEYVPQEVGTYIMDVYAAGQKIPESPVFYKVYDSSLIKVTEAGNGVVGQPCQFRVDASQAGEGQLGMISHKNSPITIFGHKHEIKNFIKKFDIFHKKNFNSLRFWFIFGIKLRILNQNCNKID